WLQLDLGGCSFVCSWARDSRERTGVASGYPLVASPVGWSARRPGASRAGPRRAIRDDVRLGGHGGLLPGRERLPELFARADPELREHLVQVVLDGSRADEQLRADLGVGVPVAGQARDLRLLCRELVTRLDGALAYRLAGRRQLTPGALGEPLRAHAAEHLVGGPQPLAGVRAPVLPAQPLAVQEQAARELELRAAAREPVDRLAVGRLVVVQQAAAARLDADRPVGGARRRALAEALEGGRGLLGTLTADTGLDQLGERPAVVDGVLVPPRTPRRTRRDCCKATR